VKHPPLLSKVDGVRPYVPDLLAARKPLPHEGWSQTATVTGAGKVLDRSVLYDADGLARHERPHLKQVERIVNTVHR